MPVQLPVEPGNVQKVSTQDSSKQLKLSRRQVRKGGLPPAQGPEDPTLTGALIVQWKLDVLDLERG